MAEPTSTQRQAYPLPVYNYQVTVAGNSMSFSEVSGIATEYDVVTYRHGLSFWEGEGIQTFRFDSYVTVTLVRGIALGASPLFLSEWIRKRDSRPVEVNLCDETGTPVLAWKIATAVPFKLQAPSFDAKSNEVAIERLELKSRGISFAEL